MCGRFVLKTPPAVLAKIFDLFEVRADDALVPRYNIAPTQPVPIIRRSRDNERRELAVVHWGLIPWWADDPSIGNRLINARSESAARSRAFKSAFERRRCIVPADGFYEWEKLDGGKQPWFIHRADGQPFAFAGLWERWRADEEAEPVDSCTILTTPANSLVEPIHDRIPAVLEHDDFEMWLDREIEDPASVAKLLRPLGAKKMKAYRVSTFVNKPENDAKKCIEPLEPGEPPDKQPRLF